MPIGGYGSTGGGAGIPGPRGPEGKQGPAGPVGSTGLSWPQHNGGEWDPAYSYAPLDAVGHAGSTWRAKVASTGVEPGTDNAVWGRLAERGEPGQQGPRGADGAPSTVAGPKGDKGDPGADGLDAVQLHIGTTPPTDTSRPWLDTSGS